MDFQAPGGTESRLGGANTSGSRRQFSSAIQGSASMALGLGRASQSKFNIETMPAFQIKSGSGIPDRSVMKPANYTSGEKLT